MKKRHGGIQISGLYDSGTKTDVESKPDLTQGRDHGKELDLGKDQGHLNQDLGMDSGHDLGPDLSSQKVIVLDQLKAFPTAQGAGAGTSGGRGGKIVYVTNNDDKGPGSLHEALFKHNDEKRTILFATGGRFDLPENRTYWNSGNFTLAGQSAHDLGGVHLFSTLKDGQDIDDIKDSKPEDVINGGYYLIDSKNMIIGYISAKGGWEQNEYNLDPQRAYEGWKQAFITRFSVDVIYDHFSTGWAGGYSFLLGGRFHSGNFTEIGRITMQYSLAHENGRTQNVGGLIGAYWNKLPGTDQEKTALYNTMFGRVDLHHNAFIQMTHRHTGNVYAGPTGEYKRISNYIYGVGSRLDRHIGDFKSDYINNFYELSGAKPSTTKSGLHKLYFSDDRTAPPGRGYAPSIFMNGNESFSLMEPCSLMIAISGICCPLITTLLTRHGMELPLRD